LTISGGVDLNIKPRFESLELRILRSLNYRMKLSDKTKNHYLYLEKGFIGEKIFDDWVERYINGGLNLNDLLIESSNSISQIDSLLLTQGKIHLFDVKNNEGDYFIEGDRWYTNCKIEIKNPVYQLKRCETLLRRLLQAYGFNPPIESHLVFVNPEFHLYQAPLNLPIVYPTQIKRFLEKLNMKTSSPTADDYKIAEQLLSVHMAESPYTRLPEYSFELLEKGIVSSCCGLFLEVCKEDTLFCRKCHREESLNSAVLRSAEEFVLLFPGKKITTNSIHEWCKVVKSKKTVRKILMKNFKPMGYGKHFYFVHNGQKIQ
jgi:hypothetical protein